MLIIFGTSFSSISVLRLSILVLLAHLYWYSLLIHIGTPCLSISVFRAHTYWYSGFLYWYSVLIYIVTPCSSILVLRTRTPPNWYSFLSHLGFLRSSILVFRASPYLHSVLTHRLFILTTPPLYSVLFQYGTPYSHITVLRSHLFCFSCTIPCPNLACPNYSNTRASGSSNFRECECSS
jgi:hypothetical protein